MSVVLYGVNINFSKQGATEVPDVLKLGSEVNI